MGKGWHRSIICVGLLSVGAACADDTSEPDASADAAPDATLDASEPSPDASGANDAAVSVEPLCTVELNPMPAANEPAPACRAETYGSPDEPSFLSFWVTQGERSLFVYWEHLERAPGTAVDLPFVDGEGRHVTVDYITPDFDAFQRAVRGTVRLEVAAGRYYRIELEDVGFDALPELELNGTIGAELQHAVCLICK